MWEWLWQGENLSWMILGIAGVWFAFTELPKLIWSIKNTSNYGDDDPSGNDNAAPRKPYDYL